MQHFPAVANRPTVLPENAKTTPPAPAGAGTHRPPAFEQSPFQPPPPPHRPPVNHSLGKASLDVFFPRYAFFPGGLVRPAGALYDACAWRKHFPERYGINTISTRDGVRA